MIIRNYRISNTNGNARQRDAVRVYNPGGELIGEVFPPQRNPLRYVRNHNGFYRKSLISQLENAGVPLIIIEEITLGAND